MSNETELDLDAIEARADAATPGPWGWRGNMDHDDPRLTARGRDVLGHVRRERTTEDPGAKEYAAYLRDLTIIEQSTGSRSDERNGQGQTGTRMRLGCL